MSSQVGDRPDPLGQGVEMGSVQRLAARPGALGEVSVADPLRLVSHPLDLAGVEVELGGELSGDVQQLASESLGPQVALLPGRRCPHVVDGRDVGEVTTDVGNAQEDRRVLLLHEQAARARLGRGQRFTVGREQEGDRQQSRLASPEPRQVVRLNRRGRQRRDRQLVRESRRRSATSLTTERLLASLVPTSWTSLAGQVVDAGGDRVGGRCLRRRKRAASGADRPEESGQPFVDDVEPLEEVHDSLVDAQRAQRERVARCRSCSTSRHERSAPVGASAAQSGSSNTDIANANVG